MYPMFVSPSQIAPSQDFLKPGTVKFILECIENNRLNELPPNPIVRKDDEGNMIAIDGHNLIAVKHYLGQDVAVHVATSADDGLPETSEANVQRNRDLKEKYDSVLKVRVLLHQQNVDSFSDLLKLYPDLFA